MTASAAAVSLTTEVVRQGLPVEKSCGCNGRRLPIRVQVAGLVELSQALKTSTTPASAGTELLTYNCKRCGEVVSLTLGDLYLEV